MGEKLDKANVAKMLTESTDIVSQAEGMVVNNKTQLAAASVILGGIKALLKEADKEYDPNIKRWNTGHKAAIADKKKIVNPLLGARAFVNNLVTGYHKRMTRIAEKAAREKEAKLRAEAEVKRKAEEERLAALRAELEDFPESHDTALEQEVVEEMEEEIAKVEEELAAPPAEIIVEARSAPSVDGIVIPKTYKAKVVDKGEFVRFCLETIWNEKTDLPPLSYLKINESLLNARARKEKEKFDIPGCELVIETGVRSTG